MFDKPTADANFTIYLVGLQYILDDRGKAYQKSANKKSIGKWEKFAGILTNCGQRLFTAFHALSKGLISLRFFALAFLSLSFPRTSSNADKEQIAFFALFSPPEFEHRKTS